MIDIDSRLAVSVWVISVLLGFCVHFSGIWVAVCRWRQARDLAQTASDRGDLIRLARRNLRSEIVRALAFFLALAVGVASFRLIINPVAFSVIVWLLVIEHVLFAVDGILNRFDDDRLV